jgi:hypothetical protein
MLTLKSKHFSEQLTNVLIYQLTTMMLLRFKFVKIMVVLKMLVSRMVISILNQLIKMSVTLLLISELHLHLMLQIMQVPLM